MKPLTSLGRFFRHFISKYIPKIPPTPVFSGTREKITPLTREIKTAQKPQNPFPETKEFPPKAELTPSPSPEVHQCPYCLSKNVVKRGLREKKYEVQQRYLCNDCKRAFVPQRVKGKSFPLKLILEGLSFYNTGYTLEESCRFLKERFGIEVKDSTLSDWIKEFQPLCRYSRFRPYGLKLFSPAQVIQTVHLFHRQVYDFSVHRGKLALLLQEYRNNKFDNLREFLEAIQSECPHQFFQEGERSSELKVEFDLHEVLIRQKQNFATRLAGLALQAVSDNKLRHKALQRFMLCNDSVTVAVEVPLYMDSLDIEHMQEELKFKIPIQLIPKLQKADNASADIETPSPKDAGLAKKNNGIGDSSTPGSKSAPRRPSRVITGHIDILQLRNGAVHILDYKPQDKDKRRIKPVTQLTLYALMLSRLTGLRLYDFKCAWFDENAYFEFFPLHVVYKLRSRVKKEDLSQLKLGFKEEDGDVPLPEDL